MRRLLAVAAVALVVPGAAEAARFAVGLEPGTDRAVLAAKVEARTGGTVEPLAPFALVLDAAGARGVARLRGVTYVERLDGRARRLAFAPTDPLYGRQWYLGAIRAFDAWTLRPALPGLRIAVIDSGIDAGHPEFAGRIADARSFVGGSARRDTHGHGTFIAGLIAARLNNDEGIAGLAFPAQLLVAKVVRADGVVPLEAEARAIRWAADRGASVINLSLGAIRDPRDPSRDSFSPLEASAVEYAIRKGAVVVAAVGNNDQAPNQPWRFASYPAALPHVLGVSALSREGSASLFSNRDSIYNDIAAPGEELFSTLPRAITAARPGCELQGYSECGPTEYRRAQGTSFAAALVSAAAALVRLSWPNLSAAQIMGLMERSATDMTATNGCRRCSPNRDALTGWGRLDVEGAINYGGRLPPRDRYETNDDVGARAYRIRRRVVRLHAALDFWNDQNDVYAVRMRRGQRLSLALTGPPSTDTNLVLWKPGTRTLGGLRSLTLVAKQSARPGARERLRYTARRAGVYYVHVKISSPGAGSYTLRISRRS